MLSSLLLPFANITFLTPPPAPADPVPGGLTVETLLVWAVLAVVGGGSLLAILRTLLALLTRRPATLLRQIVVDGSNVMHWKGETPELATVQDVVRLLQQRGFRPGVVFDANAGYKLGGRHMNDVHLARLLGLPLDQVHVVGRGEPADPVILAAARDAGAPVVSCDRFRDWAVDYPEVTRPGFLLRGGFGKDGALWLEEPLAEPQRAAG